LEEDFHGSGLLCVDFGISYLRATGIAMGGDLPAELGWQLGDFNRRILNGAAMASQEIGRRFSGFGVVVCGFRYFVLSCLWYSDGGDLPAELGWQLGSVLVVNK